MDKVSTDYSLVRTFLENEYFSWDFVFVSPSILVIDTLIYKNERIPKYLRNFLVHYCSFDSLGVVIPQRVWGSEWAFFPDKSSNIFSQYEELIKQNIVVDIFVISDKLFDKISKIRINKSYFSPNFLKHLWKSIYTEESHINNDIYKDYKEQWIEYIIQKYIFRFLPIGVEGSLDTRIKKSYKNYSLFLELRNFLTSDYFWRDFSKVIDNFFIREELYKIKFEIQFLSILLKEWFTTFEKIIERKTDLSLKTIQYKSNVAVKPWITKFRWNIYKVYNKRTSSSFPSWAIMICKTTHPEFMNAFWKASFVCAETSSELSHAAITCRELWIPLALGAKNIFFAHANGDSIDIDIKKRQINIL